MEVEFARLAPKQRYKLLIGLVVPRPIALVTTMSPGGGVNAAPFSFFNVFSEDPALVVLGIERRQGVTRKDTAANIEATGEFVVNLVDEALAERMNLCAVDFPPEESELAAAGLTPTPMRLVACLGVAEAPAALECRHWRTIAVANGRELVIGEVVAARMRDDLVDPETLRIDHAALRPIGRLAGDGYCRTRDTFQLTRPSLDSLREAGALAAKGSP